MLNVFLFSILFVACTPIEREVEEELIEELIEYECPAKVSPVDMQKNCKTTNVKRIYRPTQYQAAKNQYLAYRRPNSLKRRLPCGGHEPVGLCNYRQYEKRKKTPKRFDSHKTII